MIRVFGSFYQQHVILLWVINVDNDNSTFSGGWPDVQMLFVCATVSKFLSLSLCVFCLIEISKCTTENYQLTCALPAELVFARCEYSTVRYDNVANR